MPLHDHPIDKRVDALLALSHEHAEIYCSPSAWLARERYLANHPTRILAMKCMDGRIHLPTSRARPWVSSPPSATWAASFTWAGRTSARCSPTPSMKLSMAAAAYC
ncbi:hypothetical protein [Billgrantia tianxiuensis]|uniref:hypothetical protein n=1 Tax=Billgrantia tianxiuensis TaxID=2497861 RepID=UPI0030EE14FC